VSSSPVNSIHRRPTSSNHDRLTSAAGATTSPPPATSWDPAGRDRSRGPERVVQRRFILASWRSPLRWPPSGPALIPGPIPGCLEHCRRKPHLGDHRNAFTLVDWTIRPGGLARWRLALHRGRTGPQPQQVLPFRSWLFVALASSRVETTLSMVPRRTPVVLIRKTRRVCGSSNKASYRDPRRKTERTLNPLSRVHGRETSGGHVGATLGMVFMVDPLSDGSLDLRLWSHLGLAELEEMSPTWLRRQWRPTARAAERIFRRPSKIGPLHPIERWTALRPEGRQPLAPGVSVRK
jgi:hypothetical protein